MDLDPGPGIDWGELVHATRLTRTLLEKLGLKAFLEWDEVKEFTRLVAQFLAKAEPDLFTCTYVQTEFGL